MYCRGKVRTDSYELCQSGVVLRYQVVRKPGEGLLYPSDAAAEEDGGSDLAMVERREVNAEARDEDGG